MKKYPKKEVCKNCYLAVLNYKTVGNVLISFPNLPGSQIKVMVIIFFFLFIPCLQGQKKDFPSLILWCPRQKYRTHGIFLPWFSGVHTKVKEIFCSFSNPRVSRTKVRQWFSFLLWSPSFQDKFKGNIHFSSPVFRCQGQYSVLYFVFLPWSPSVEGKL